MSLLDTADLSLDGLHILYCTISIAFQSFFYAIHAIFAPIALYTLWRKGWKTRPNVTLFSMVLVSFGLSSVYWAWEIAVQAARIIVSFVHRDTKLENFSLSNYNPVLNAVLEFNYVFSDAIVVWRAWILCREDYRRSILLPILCLACAIPAGAAVLAIRVTLCIANTASKASRTLTRASNISQDIGLILSLMTNVTATALIGHKAWRYCLLINETLDGSRHQGQRLQRLLALLIESGFIYSIAGIVLLIAAFIRLPWGTLGDYYNPVYLEFAGVYPTVVVVMAHFKYTLDHTTFHQSDAVSSAGQQNRNETNAQELSSCSRLSSFAQFGNELHFNEGEELTALA
ncbi:hypothetical protein NM688_g2598 [Phlebia brevispora]|uniref:Uncharacterized protein n=1 Tax=Phlebia brevispora TaxID=194682 RepID=A0ACC1T821_9APHY|nr:hypothetical protein NM688_g2598 [Phlebia brevispora]